MLDFELLKKSNIKADTIDLNKSFASYNSNTYNLIIELFLKKEERVNCPIFDSKNILIRGSRCNQIKSTTLDSKNVIFNVHRRIYKCECNHIFTQENPIGYENRRISVQKEIMILNALRDKTKTYSSVAKEYDVSVSYVVNLFDTKVDLRRLSLPPVLCIDEVYAKKLVKYSYCFVLYGPQWKKIVDVIDSRRKLDLIAYFSRIPMEEKNKVEFVSMDLWDFYRDVMKKCLPKAKISADPFIRIMENWHDEIINSFNKINNHKITNGSMERVNRNIKTIFSISFGSTNFDRVRNRIIYSINEGSPSHPYQFKVPFILSRLLSYFMGPRDLVNLRPPRLPKKLMDHKNYYKKGILYTLIQPIIIIYY